jgi:hypothetical protein
MTTVQDRGARMRRALYIVLRCDLDTALYRFRTVLGAVGVTRCSVNQNTKQTLNPAEV